MNINEWEIVRSAFEVKASALFHLSEKPYAFFSLPTENYTEKFVKGRRYITIETNWFKDVIYRDLLLATTKLKQNFGTGKTSDVLIALKQIMQVNDLFEFGSFLQNENFCIVFDIDNMRASKSLRIDLFRIDHKNTFTGGLFHAYNHFNYLGTPLSTGKGERTLMHPKFMIDYAIDAFYNYKFEIGNKPQTFVSYAEFDESKLKFVFYFDHKSDVYFISTVHFEN